MSCHSVCCNQFTTIILNNARNKNSAIIPHHNWLIWTKNVALLSLKYIRYDNINLNHRTITVTAPLHKIILGCYSNHLDICTVVCTSIQLWNITIFSARFHISAHCTGSTSISQISPWRDPCLETSIPLPTILCIGSGTPKCFPKAQCQRKLTRSVLLTCWYKAAFVGGMLSRDLRLWVFKHKPSCFISRKTGTALTVQSTVSCSVHCTWREFSASCCRLFIKLIIVSFASIKFIQALHPVFFPMSNVKCGFVYQLYGEMLSGDRPWQCGAYAASRGCLSSRGQMVWCQIGRLIR